MKLLKSNKKWVLAVIGLLIALFILKIVLFLTAKPKVTVDYVVEYNKISLPSDYNPEYNAAPYYQKAFDSFIEPPKELGWLRGFPNIQWPTGINDTEKVLFEKWLISNTLAFEYFKKGSNKLYYWIERKSENNSIGGMLLPELGPFRELSRALIWDAKVKAVKEEFKPAFENILTCYKAGSHKCRPNLDYIEQQNGLAIKQESIDATMVILDRTKVPSEDLKFLQDALQEELDNVHYVPSIQLEKYYLNDLLQRTFIENGKGTGKLAFSVCLQYVSGIWPPPEGKCLYCLNCFIGPTRNEVEEQIERLIAISDQIMSKTPWQIKNEKYNYFEEIENIKSSNWFFYISSIYPKGLFYSYHKIRAQTDALITVLAILRFKNDYNRLPENLVQLVSTGYLKSLPKDPYNNGPLVYKLTEDDFLLYSVGKDFIDDGGVARPPGPPTETSYDIIYWPVRLSPPWPVRPKSQ